MIEDQARIERLEKANQKMQEKHAKCKTLEFMKFYMVSKIEV